MALLAVDHDVPGRLLDKAVDHAQPEAGALAGAFRGEERIEYLVEHRGRDAGPGIAHRDHGVAAGPDVTVRPRIIIIENDEAGLDDQLASVRHGVAGVEGQIEDRGGELIGIDDRRTGLILEHGFDLDMLAERPLQQFRGVDDQRVDVGYLWFERLLARECEQLLGEVGAARGGLVDHSRDGGKLRFALDGIGQNFDRSRDHGQNVVEVVRDAAGELAHGLHLLGLPDPVLGRDPVGEVADESVEQEASTRPQRGDAQLDRDFLSVAPPDLEFAAGLTDCLIAGKQEGLQGFLEGALPVRLAHQIEHIPAERFIARPAEDVFSLGIPVPDTALLVDLDEGVQRGVDDAARELLAFAQRLLRQPALGHVATDEEEAPGRLGPCSEP